MIIKKFDIKWLNNCNYTNYTSLSIWKNYILANRMNSNTIEIFDNTTGKYLDDILDKDIGIFEIKNVDDILIINDILFRVDYFLGVCQVYNLKSNDVISVFIFKNLKLLKSLYEYDNNKYILYGLDNINNNILRYEIEIIDDYIKNIKKNRIINLPKVNISNILIDFKFDRILINDKIKSKLYVLDLKGNILNMMNIEISNIIIHNNFYIYTDNEKDTNMIHLINRDNLNYKMSYYSEEIKNITYMESVNEDIYILDNDCTLAKIFFKNNNNLLFIILGVIISGIFK